MKKQSALALTATIVAGTIITGTSYASEESASSKNLVEKTDQKTQPITITKEQVEKAKRAVNQQEKALQEHVQSVQKAEQAIDEQAQKQQQLQQDLAISSDAEAMITLQEQVIADKTQQKINAATELAQAQVAKNNQQEEVDHVKKDLDARKSEKEKQVAAMKSAEEEIKALTSQSLQAEIEEKKSRISNN